jgi:hypothetical protein
LLQILKSIFHIFQTAVAYHQRGKVDRSRHEDQTEFIHDVRNSILAKPEEQPERHVLDYPRFVYCYVKKEANIFLRVCGRHANQFIASLEPGRSTVFDDEVRLNQIGQNWKSCFGSPQSDSYTLVSAEAAHNAGTSESNKQSMLVNVVQFIQDPEINIPSLVRTTALAALALA